MTQIVPGRQTVVKNERFVVFLIGARVNKWWLLPISLPVLIKFQKMSKELLANPESGLLATQELGFGGTVQYWKSEEHLRRYAQDRTQTHEPVWRTFMKKLFKPAAIGVWHETYLIDPGQYECIYSNMPRFGLGKVGPLVEAKAALSTAQGRLNYRSSTSGDQREVIGGL